MEYDYIAADEKRKEMEELVKNIIINNTTEDFKKATCFDTQKMSSEITDSLIEITSNEYENSTCPIQITPPGCEVSSHRAIKIPNGFTGRTKSTKLGNIKLNWKKLCILSCESIFPLTAATHMPWLSLFAALVVCNKFWSLLNIPLTELDAIVIWTMWKNKDQDDCIEAKGVLGLVNAELSTYSHPHIDQQKLEMTIKNLEKMRCIEETKEDKWRLIEEVKVTY